MNGSRRNICKTLLEKQCWQTVVCENGVIASWHPPKNFPYEHSRPVDLTKVEAEKKKFLARVNNTNKFDKWPYGEKGPDDFDLREIFYTNKEEWLSRIREKRLYSAAAPVERKPQIINTIEALKSNAISDQTIEPNKERQRFQKDDSNHGKIENDKDKRKH